MRALLLATLGLPATQRGGRQGMGGAPAPGKLAPRRQARFSVAAAAQTGGPVGAREEEGTGRDFASSLALMTLGVSPCALVVLLHR